MKPTLLVDGDIYLYQASAVSEYEVDWGEDHWTLHADFAKAKTILSTEMKELHERFEPAHLVFAVSDKANWRKRFYPAYKANRKSKRKPVCYPALKEWAAHTYQCVGFPTLEADDVLGILATQPLHSLLGPIFGERIIVSEDKDMKTLPCVLFNPAKDETPTRITEEEADYNHLMQALSGDTTDGYPGCPGVGPVKAKKILDGVEPDKRWGAVEEAYQKAKKTKAFAMQMAVMARILRHGDMDIDTGELLWTPN